MTLVVVLSMNNGRCGILSRQSVRCSSYYRILAAKENSKCQVPNSEQQEQYRNLCSTTAAAAAAATGKPQQLYMPQKPLYNQQQQHQQQRRWYSVSTPSLLLSSFYDTPTTAASANNEKLRVAIVGGGVAGLSSALHLAPLVEEGLIASPIDIFDSTSKDNTGRDIGVGLWTTALDPFGASKRPSHQSVYQDLTQVGKVSTWIDHVGYRTPNGSWLMRSVLPGNPQEHVQSKFPGLLFMRERDLLGALLKAVIYEEHMGTLKLHRDRLSHVEGVAHDEWWSRGQMQHPWSAKLEFKKTTNQYEQDEKDKEEDIIPTTTNTSSTISSSGRDYHLIVAADGTHSNLRRKYGGVEAFMKITASAGTLSSPSMDVSLSSVAVAAKASSSSSSSMQWNEAGHQEAVGLQDRNYTVFRGNSPITSEELNRLDPYAKLDNTHHISFQTWGTGKSMRFATVPLFCPPAKQNTSSPPGDYSRKEHQVWFITVNDHSIAQEQDPIRRRDLMLEHFKDWHAPIADIVRATDPESIVVERAVAHRHCMGPVLNLNQVLQSYHKKNNHSTGSSSSRIESATLHHHHSGMMDPDRPYAGGPGPALVFLGDAYMTVDPILAQGFTMAMEGSSALYETVRRALTAQSSELPPPLAFDPYVLRDELSIRHEARMDRLICLLRATELVQALGQPERSSLMGMLNTHGLRPLTKFTPNFIKRPLFDRVLKYSPGL